MKYLFIILFTLIVSGAKSQTLKASAKIGSIKIESKIFDLDKKTSKTEAQTIGKATPTEHKAIYKKKEYTVYKTAKDKLFIVYLNSKGNYSKKYLPDAEK